MTLAELNDNYWFTLGMFVGGFWLVYFSFRLAIITRIAGRILSGKRRRGRKCLTRQPIE